MECKQTMYVRGLCRLKYGLLWAPINTFLFAQISSNLARSIVRCFLSNCEILISMRQKLRKMLFFIFIFQIEEQILYFFPSRIRYGVFNIYNLKKKIVKKYQILRLQMMNMCEVTLLLRQTLVSSSRLKDVAQLTPSIDCPTFYFQFDSFCH